MPPAQCTHASVEAVLEPRIEAYNGGETPPRDLHVMKVINCSGEGEVISEPALSAVRSRQAWIASAHCGDTTESNIDDLHYIEDVRLAGTVYVGGDEGAIRIKIDRRRRSPKCHIDREYNIAQVSHDMIACGIAQTGAATLAGISDTNRSQRGGVWTRMWHRDSGIELQGGQIEP
jgi:hypothetical protein